MTPNQKADMIHAIKLLYAAGMPILKLSQMSGWSTQKVAEIVQEKPK